jgi:hypothetical protein
VHLGTSTSTSTLHRPLGDSRGVGGVGDAHALGERNELGAVGGRRSPGREGAHLPSGIGVQRRDGRQHHHRRRRRALRRTQAGDGLLDLGASLVQPDVANGVVQLGGGGDLLDLGDGRIRCAQAHEGVGVAPVVAASQSAVVPPRWGDAACTQGREHTGDSCVAAVGRFPRMA